VFKAQAQAMFKAQAQAGTGTSEHKRTQAITSEYRRRRKR